MKFLQVHFKSLNYDAQQIYSLLSTYIKNESTKSQIASDSIVQRWSKEIEGQKILRIEKIYTVESDDENQDEDDSNKNGYDSLINSNCDENFVISLSTDREEICVWNVLKWVKQFSNVFTCLLIQKLVQFSCTKVRTLKSVPQPSSVCPVGDFDLAVLCKREIRVIDLNEGKFKVKWQLEYNKSQLN